LRADDVLLVSYPKSGSTWLRFLLAHALTSAEPDFDSIRSTLPPLGLHQRAPRLVAGGGRLIRSHEPLGAAPALGRQAAVYLVRDARDVALSYFEHERRSTRFDGELLEFLAGFTQGNVGSYGSWQEHVLSALAHETAGRVPFLRVRYEDLRADTVGELARILRFLGVEPDAAALVAVVEANTKARMRAKESSSTFLRSMPTDGSAFVRPDRDRGWTELVPESERARFERACGAALTGAGYTLEHAQPAAGRDRE
jgi:hypothetical protein